MKDRLHQKTSAHSQQIQELQPSVGQSFFWVCTRRMKEREASLYAEPCVHSPISNTMIVELSHLSVHQISPSSMHSS